MNGPQHFREAEKLLEQSAKDPLGSEGRYYLAAAQVHATLALAAATAQPSAVRYYGDENRSDRAWAQVIEP